MQVKERMSKRVDREAARKTKRCDEQRNEEEASVRERQIGTEGKTKERKRVQMWSTEGDGERRDELISFSVIRRGGTALPNSASARQIYPRYQELSQVPL